MNKMFTLNSDKHNMFINNINKVSLSSFDEKRYICDNGIDTQPMVLILCILFNLNSMQQIRLMPYHHNKCNLSIFLVF